MHASKQSFVNLYSWNFQLKMIILLRFFDIERLFINFAAENYLLARDTESSMSEIVFVHLMITYKHY